MSTGVSPVVSPNTIRPRPTPHSGYHWNGRQHPFFEGWYYRLTLPPEQGNQTIAFMYSLQDPGKQTTASGGTVQILGPNEQYFCRSLPEVSQFWAWPYRLGHGHSRRGPERYRVTDTQHTGQFWCPVTGNTVRWHYALEPVYTWGAPQRPQSTAGWLSQFQIFEPGWQVLMAHGWATGWFESVDAAGRPIHRFDFERVPAYGEKNWGGAFPKKWFWLQCNAFEQEPDLTLTAAGGIRQVLGQQESVGMVGVHHGGNFYEFVPWNGQIAWQVAWGHWRVWAEQPHYAVELMGHTDTAGVNIRVPTATGMEFLCRDTTQGTLSLNLWRKHNKERQLILSAHSQQAGLEIGGKHWHQPWCHGY